MLLMQVGECFGMAAFLSLMTCNFGSHKGLRERGLLHYLIALFGTAACTPILHQFINAPAMKETQCLFMEA